MLFGRFWKDESGQALVMATVFMTLLLALLGLAVDVGMLFRARRMAQTAADAAAMAAAIDYKFSTSASNSTRVAHAQSEGIAAATANGYTSTAGDGVTVNISQLTTGIFATCADCFQAIVASPKSTNFMSMFGFQNLQVAGKAVAGVRKTEPCMLLTGNTGSDFTNGGAATITLDNCSFVDNSTGGGLGAFVNSGALTMTATSLGALGVVGNVDNGGAMSTTPTIQTGIKPVGFPLTLPTPSTTGCSATVITSGSHGPGCYSGISVTGASTITLSPGLYVINGPISIKGASTITGTGVTIYFNGAFTIGGAVTMDLSAPTTAGTWNGILLYESPGDTNTLTVGGAMTGDLTGIIYVPNATVDLASATNLNLHSVFVAKQLTNGGGFNLTLNDYLTINPLSPLATVTLME